MIVKKPVKKKKISRYTVLLIVMGIIFTAIIGKLIYLQVLRRNDYKERANKTSTRFVSERAPRGIIYDSEGNILATNKQVYTLTYTQTPEANKHFFDTVDEINKILKENNISINDDMLLKLDENGKPYYEFKTTSTENQQAEQIRFLRDRGLNEKIAKELFPKEEELTEEQNKKINYKLLEIGAEEAFYELVKQYGIIAKIDPAPSTDSPNYKEEKEAYDQRQKKYSEMTPKEITELLLKSMSMEQIRNYVLIKDAIKMQSFSGERFVTIASNISENAALTIYQKINDLPGINIQRDPIRDYPYNNLGSTVLGYIAPISSTQKEKYEMRGYDASTDLIGMQGIESAFEDQLRGKTGGTSVKVNSKGKITEKLFQLESYPGNNVHLTIDKDIQYATEMALKDTIDDIRANKSDKGERYPNATRGAAIAVDVNTGKILSLASYPNFNPNDFAIPGQLSNEEVQKYFTPVTDEVANELIKKLGIKKSIDEVFPKDPKSGLREDKYDLVPKPFYNYATLGILAPGSIFKPLTSIAALESGVVGVNETITDVGQFIKPGLYNSTNGPYCHNRAGHGPVNVVRALQVSCNYYYYEAAYRMYKKNLETMSQTEALDSLAEYAWKFGLGHDPARTGNAGTGIEVEENLTGQTYNFESWKENMILYSKFELRDALEAGVYGDYKFIPFDYSARIDDSDELKIAKEELKKKIEERFRAIGTNEKAEGFDSYVKTITPYVKKIMELSPKYQESLKNAKGDIDKEAKKVASAIAQFVIHDKGSQMTTPGQLVSAAIGQGMNNYTPLQLASYISTLANGGTRYALHLVDKVTTPDGEVVQQFNPQVLDKIDIKPENLAAVKAGMSAANEQDGGTAAAVFRNFPIPTAGKTGTADFSNTQREVGRAPFATYVSFAPTDKPEIAFVGVIFDGGHGSWTAPVAKAVFEAYFKERLLAQNPNYAASSPSFQKYVLGAPENNKDLLE